MLSDWRIRHAGTADSRRSATGATIAPGSSGTAGGAPTAIHATKVFKAIAATAVTIATEETIGTHEIIATHEIIGTIGADIQASFGKGQAAFSNRSGDDADNADVVEIEARDPKGGASRSASRLKAKFKRG
jgi:hypothetical protein